MHPPLSARIASDYRQSNGGQIYSLAKKHRLPRKEVKALINSMLVVASCGGNADAARRNIARFDKKWRGR